MTTKERKSSQKVQYDILRCHRKEERTQRLMGLFKRTQGPQRRGSQWPILLRTIRTIVDYIGWVKSHVYGVAGIIKTKGVRQSSYLSLIPSVPVPLTAKR